jgi:carbonic anhydrase/acetyltransferase-like protein (isoleucine patch superfamily)
VGERARIGNFVEAKNAQVGPGAKANHLTYLGDAVVGAGANVGAGTITANYDGFNKHKTEIGADASIGSNSVLVAPVKIGRGAIVGAGSVITQSVSADALALARGRQAEKPGWAAKFRESKGTLGKGTVIRHGDKAFRVTITRPDGTVLPTGPATVRVAPAKVAAASAKAPTPAAPPPSKAPEVPRTAARISNGETPKPRKTMPQVKAAPAAKPRKPDAGKKPVPVSRKGKR